MLSAREVFYQARVLYDDYESARLKAGFIQERKDWFEVPYTTKLYWMQFALDNMRTI